ncbi:MAG: precorrin-6A reductase [Thermodesulfobacteriota bacterium]
MILLVGGTSETAPLATALAAAGFTVLVSTATRVPLDVGSHPNIFRRSGELDREGLEKVAVEHGIELIVDGSHPYASSVRKNAKLVAARLSLPYVSWVRPAVIGSDEVVHVALNHADAAMRATSFGKPVLLTVGSRNLAPYAAEAAKARVPLIARVLDHEESLEAAVRAGIPRERIIAGRGPFSVEDNLAVIKQHRIGCLVTKDSGEAGGVPAKIEAARQTGCAVVVVARPSGVGDTEFESISQLVEHVKKQLAGKKKGTDPRSSASAGPGDDPHRLEST